MITPHNAFRTRGRITAALLFFCPILTALAQSSFYVDPVNGSDGNAGTSLASAVRTIGKAQEKVRSVSAGMTSDINVYLVGGRYELSSAITFSEADSGRNGYYVRYRAYNSQKPIISGGRAITGWTQVASSSLWQANCSIDNFRQLYVNGQRAVRARTEARYTGTGWYDDTSNSVDTHDGILVGTDVIGTDWSNKSDMELVYNVEWYNRRAAVKDVVSVGGSNAIVMDQPYFYWHTAVISNYPWNYDSSFYLENAFELLDRPGEWYLDRTLKKVYYIPRVGEDMSTAEVYAPAVERLLTIEGSSLANKVHDITFEGLQIEHGSWIEPSVRGYCSWQGPSYFSGDSTAPVYTFTLANIFLQNAHDIQFTGNTIQHMGGTAIYARDGVYNVDVIGNRLTDISACAIMVGRDTHDFIDPGEELCKNITIDNNFISRAAVEYLQCIPLFSFYVDGLKITHNEIADSPYSAISVGWGWNDVPTSTTCRNNVISNNYIHDFMSILRDGGGIYTLGQQPNSVCSGNYIRNMFGANGALYHDEGSAYYTTNGNVIENAPRWIYIWTSSIHDISASNNYSTTSNYQNSGTNTTINAATVESNWSTAALNIIAAAGLQASYKYLADTENFIGNPGLETGTLAGWTAYGGGGVTNSSRYSGSYSGVVNGTSASLDQVVTGLKPNRHYMLQAKVKAGAGGTIYLGIKNHGNPERSVASSSTTYTTKSVGFTTGLNNTNAEAYIWTSNTVNSYGDDFSVIEYVNPIVNGDLEAGLSSWTTYGGGYLASVGPYAGNYSAYVNGTSAGFEQVVTGLTPNTSYTLQAQLKAGSGGTVYLAAKEFGGADVAVGSTTTSFTLKSVTFTTGATNTSARICLWTGDTVGSYGDQFVLFKN